MIKLKVHIWKLVWILLGENQFNSVAPSSDVV